MKHQCSTGAVDCFLMEEVNWMFAPVPERVEVMSGVVSVVEGMTIGLRGCQRTLRGANR